VGAPAKNTFKCLPELLCAHIISNFQSAIYLTVAVLRLERLNHFETFIFSDLEENYYDTFSNEDKYIPPQSFKKRLTGLLITSFVKEIVK